MHGCHQLRAEGRGEWVIGQQRPVPKPTKPALLTMFREPQTVHFRYMGGDGVGAGAEEGSGAAATCSIEYRVQHMATLGLVHVARTPSKMLYHWQALGCGQNS